MNRTPMTINTMIIITTHTDTRKDTCSMSTQHHTHTEPCKDTAHLHKRCTYSPWTQMLWLTVRLQTQSVSNCCLMFGVFFKTLCSRCEDSTGKNGHAHTSRWTRSHDNAQNSRTAESNKRVSDQTKLPRHLRLQRQQSKLLYLLMFQMFFITVPHFKPVL